MSPNSDFDPAILAATASVHAWFRAEVLRKIQRPAKGAQGTREWLTDSRLIGRVPRLEKPKTVKRVRPCKQCKTRDAVAVGLCRYCYDQQRQRGTGRQGPRYPTEVLREMRAQGMTYAAIGRALGMHPTTIHGQLKAAAKPPASLPSVPNPVNSAQCECGQSESSK